MIVTLQSKLRLTILNAKKMKDATMVSPWRMTIITLITAAIMAGFLFLTMPAHAAPVICADREKIVEGLKKRYKETQVSVGVNSEGTQVLEIFASEAGTWTVIMTALDNKSCFMASGHSWEITPIVKGKPT